MKKSYNWILSISLILNLILGKEIISFYQEYTECIKKTAEQERVIENLKYKLNNLKKN